MNLRQACPVGAVLVFSLQCIADAQPQMVDYHIEVVLSSPAWQQEFLRIRPDVAARYHRNLDDQESFVREEKIQLGICTHSIPSGYIVTGGVQITNLAERPVPPRPFYPSDVRELHEDGVSTFYYGSIKTKVVNDRNDATKANSVDVKLLTDTLAGFRALPGTPDYLLSELVRAEHDPEPSLDGDTLICDSDDAALLKTVFFSVHSIYVHTFSTATLRKKEMADTYLDYMGALSLHLDGPAQSRYVVERSFWLRERFGLDVTSPDVPNADKESFNRQARCLQAYLNYTEPTLLGNLRLRDRDKSAIFGFQSEPPMNATELDSFYAAVEEVKDGRGYR